MIPQRFKEANILMRRPETMTPEQCFGVHAYKGHGRVITCWRPTPEERVKILLGEPIWLSLVGDTMQPAFVSADYPFVERPELATVSEDGSVK